MAERFDVNTYSARLMTASAIVCCALGALLVRLWFLQCVYGGYYRDLSENNRVRTIRMQAARGVIYDRNESVLVRNRPAFDVAIILEDVRNLSETLQVLAEVTGRELSSLQKQLQSPAKGLHFEPRLVIADVSREELARIKVNTYRLPGVIVRVVPARDYPENSVAAQVLGYAREINKTQLDALGPEAENYRLGDVIGQSGVEKQWESLLRGQAGYTQVEVDAMGHRRGELGIVDTGIGESLYLTIDKDLQRVAEQGLAGRRGAVVGLDPNTGEVLVLASSPTFDANIFSGKMNYHDWEAVSRDRNKPLANRAISSKYPPGSTWKLFMAAAGLAAGKITPSTVINCPGYYSLGGRPYKCHKHSGHGAVDLQKAITVSCNAYFYALGQMLDVDAIERYGHMFGFGETTGIDIQGEDPGILPSRSWKKAKYKEKWYPGDTVPISIGQGYLNVTPLQMAVAISAIANGGTVYKPYLLKKVVDPKTSAVQEFKPSVLHKLELSKNNAELQTVKQLAINVVSDPHGTGKRAAIPGITVAGKTGTAQVGVLGKEKLGEQFMDHAWFIAFAPVEDPKIALAIIVENSGHGGEFAAPISKRVMETYFKKLGLLKDTAPKTAEQHFEDTERAELESAEDLGIRSQIGESEPEEAQ